MIMYNYGKKKDENYDKKDNYNMIKPKIMYNYDKKKDNVQ